jgi:predicted 2-oxoglutarate/Fe(II)-dependent dioxygenase YbiX
MTSTLLTHELGPINDFNPSSDSICYCGSEKSFFSCCGSQELVRPPPKGLFLFENYVDPVLAKEITEFADGQNGERLLVIDENESTPDNIVKVEDKRRVTERVHLGEWQVKINNIVRKAFIELADRCFKQKIEWFEKPELMRYHKGGFYIRHADSQNMDVESKTWKKVIDRDLSLLIYLNEDFEGGELSFTKLNYQIRPRAGATAIFPSDHRFLHQAEIVKTGVRYAIVSWAGVRGIPRIAANPPNCAIAVSE